MSETDRQTDRKTYTKVNTEDTLSGFQEFLLQPIIKDRSNDLIPLSLGRILTCGLIVFILFSFFPAMSSTDNFTGKF